MPTNINDRLISWASDIDPGTIRQAEKTARLPIVEGHVSLMPDAHIGLGATIGSVIPTRGAVTPAAVGATPPSLRPRAAASCAPNPSSPPRQQPLRGDPPLRLGDPRHHQVTHGVVVVHHQLRAGRVGRDGERGPLHGLVRRAADLGNTSIRAHLAVHSIDVHSFPH
jgi:hypothetical protein